jgi:ATP-dependent Lon protease
VRDVRRCLDEDHLGLEKVKKRIVEYTAVRQLRADKKGPILLFVGPPGVGKTSLGKSIARAMGRRYERIALGGVRDEAEIRGHRRTYVGALPGRIIQALKKAGTKNPVLVLDEVEKMGADVRGDPTAALLEVLDPEQNGTFQDHYLDLPFDLSQVTFLATANERDAIPGPLLDRMEVIDVAGYTRAEKLGIAQQFLVPKQLRSHGLTEERLEIGPDAVSVVLDSYTREAGVRGLEREVASLCRAVAVRVAEGEDVHVKADREFVEKILGPAKYRPEVAERRLDPGVATGLSTSAGGGDLLFIEATKMRGRGQLTLTGNMRNVMQESATTAVSYVRSKATELSLDPEWLREIDLHIHVPKHGTPKDGPSAGITIFLAVLSLLLDCPVRSDLAMTGEISLRGRVLPVGGIKQKLFGAHRAGIREVLIPARNRRDLDDVPPEVLADVKVTLVSTVAQVIQAALLPPVTRAPDPEDAADVNARTAVVG